MRLGEHGTPVIPATFSMFERCNDQCTAVIQCGSFLSFFNNCAAVAPRCCHLLIAVPRGIQVNQWNNPDITHSNSPTRHTLPPLMFQTLQIFKQPYFRGFRGLCTRIIVPYFTAEVPSTSSWRLKWILAPLVAVGYKTTSCPQGHCLCTTNVVHYRT
jgi:hypothetical protein